MFKSILGFFKKFLFKSPNNEEDTVIAPCVGDIVEFEDGSRTIVISVSINEERYDVRFSKGVTKCVNNRGRQKSTLEVSHSPEAWPPENSKVFRDSQLLIPQKEWRINFIVWLSNRLLK